MKTQEEKIFKLISQIPINVSVQIDGWESNAKVEVWIRHEVAMPIINKIIKLKQTKR